MFLETLLSQLNLKPSESYLLKKMPDIFVKTGYGMTDVVIYCTELKFQHATNLDLNCLTFSIYNNNDTGKALLGISPHGTGLLFSDVLTESISDSALTEKSYALDWVEPKYEQMLNRGLSVQEHCAVKRYFFNHLSSKKQYSILQCEHVIKL